MALESPEFAQIIVLPHIKMTTTVVPLNIESILLFSF